jgi:chemotaxis signal transduction protein
MSDLLIFDIGREQFALPLDAVSAVLDTVEVHAHRAPDDHRVGVVRSGDTFIPVFGSAHVLGVECAQADPVLLVLDLPRRVALLVDHAEAALGVSLESLRDLSGLGSLDGVVVGALRPASRWVTLLDATALVHALDRRSSYAA